MTDDTTKTCPFCAETIKAAAVVCRFCGRDLNASMVVAAPRQCPNCGAALIGEMRTCISCGKSAVIESDRQLLDKEIAEYTRANWRITSQSETGFQAIKPKQWSTLGLVLLVALPAVGGCLWLPLFGVALIGLLLVFADYALKKEDSRYITAQNIRNVAAVDGSPNSDKAKIVRGTGNGRRSCSSCGGYVREDATECKHCNKVFVPSVSVA